MTTDASGFASFALEYGEQFAAWVSFEITARATVAGTESKSVHNYFAAGLSSDFTNEQIAPAGFRQSVWIPVVVLHLPQLNIALVGMPGSGKSTVGRQLARRLQLRSPTPTTGLSRASAAPSANSSSARARPAFAKWKRRPLDAITASATGGVVATGGDAVRCGPRARACLRRNAQVFYLWSSPEEVFRRLRHDQNRPLLQVADPRWPRCARCLPCATRSTARRRTT